jgi:hypothetical protein
MIKSFLDQIQGKSAPIIVLYKEVSLHNLI